MIVNPFCWFLLFCYALWMKFDYLTPRRGGRKNSWWRQLKIWNHFQEYFPLILCKETDLDPNENYIMGFHPHSLQGIGAFSTFATDNSNFSKNFPDLNFHLMVSSSNFKIPFYREILLLFGYCEFHQETAQHHFSEGKGTVLIADDKNLVQHPLHGNSDRKEMVRMALQSGASLVPVINLGESDLYNHKKDKKLLDEKQDGNMITSLTKALINYLLTYLPRRQPICIVFGHPINVPKVDQINEEVVDEYYKMYTEELTNIYKEYYNPYLSKVKNLSNL